MEARRNISIGIPPIATLQGGDSAANVEPSGSAKYQSTECILYGSVLADQKNNMLQRLRGLCDPGKQYFQEHSMIFKLKTGSDSPVQVQYRRRLNNDNCFWQSRYIGIPEVDPKMPVIVRKTIDSTIYSTTMMEFVKSLGQRLEYEYIAEGFMFTKGKIRISMYRVDWTETIGNYQKAKLKQLTDAFVVEAVTMLPEGVPHEESAKRLRDFCDQLMPLCEMRKVDYMKDS